MGRFWLEPESSGPNGDSIRQDPDKLWWNLTCLRG